MKREPTITQAHPSVHKKNFTQIDNSIIEHTNLSPLSKMLLIYLLSKPINFTFHDSSLRIFMVCGHKKLKKLFSELRKNGYVSRVAFQNEEGKFSGSKRIFADTPIYLLKNKNSCKNDLISEIPKVSFQDLSDKRTSPEKIPSFNNTDLVNNINNNNTQDPARDKTESMDVVVDIKLIGELNKNGINNATAKAWHKQYGEEAIKDKLKMLKDEVSRGTITSSKGGWLKRALERNFMPSEIKKPTYPIPSMEESKNYCEKIEKMVTESNTPKSLELRLIAMAGIKEVLKMVKAS